MPRGSQSMTRGKGVRRPRGGNRRQQTESTGNGLWSELPSELLEQVMAFLSVPDLCRLRSVCKRWNSLICTPELGTICAQNASRAATNGGACLVVNPRRSRDIIEIPTWSIFDLNAKRWYNIKNELPEGYDYDVPAMDGGLVCAFVNSVTDEQRRTSTVIHLRTSEPQTLIISNLLGGSIKVLPNPPAVGMDLPFLTLKLVVDAMSHSYKIFLLCERCSWNDRDPGMCVYESSTDQWRILSNPPVLRRINCTDVRILFFQGLLYVLFTSGIIHRLFTYNLLEDAWEDTDIQFRKTAADVCDLLVSDNRLFLMTLRVIDHRRRIRPDDVFWPLDISEISLADKVCRSVVQIPEAELRRQFRVKSQRRYLRIQAFGFDKSILLICQKDAKAVLYNLVTGVWEKLPQNPLKRVHVEPVYDHLSNNLTWHGKQMSYLRLPTNTPWI